MAGHTITDLEVFRAGKWNGDIYGTDDLDAMVEAFPLAGFQPPVKLGHDEKSGDRAFGWVSSLKRVGNVLIASIKDIPSSLYAIIKERGYDHLSAEIYWDLERNGRRFKKCLKAIALLGAETPAVAGLMPIRTVAHSLGPSRRYTFPSKEKPMNTTSDPGAVIVEMTNTYHHQHPTLSWHQAFDHIRNSDPGKRALRLYGQKRNVVEEDDFDLYPGERAADVIHSQAERRAKAEKIDYSAAVRKILDEDPSLAKAYAARR